jgi:hypothetical protein
VKPVQEGITHMEKLAKTFSHLTMGLVKGFLMAIEGGCSGDWRSKKADHNP